MPFPSELEVLTATIYPPRAKGDATRAAKNFILSGIKYDRIAYEGSDQQAIEFTITSLMDHIGGSSMEQFFSGVDWLVPMPGHGLHRPGSLWVPLRIAEALHAAGVGHRVEPCISRQEPVIKSAFAKPGERPTTKTHYSSFGLESRLVPPQSVLLVDDLVTKGATLVGGAARVLERFPSIEIRAFAIARVQDVEFENTSEMFAPLQQTICYEHDIDDVYRM